MIEIKYTIEDIACENLDGMEKAIRQVSFKISASNEDKECEIFGGTAFELTEASAFISFDDLTEDQVVRWVKKQLGEARIAEMENALISQFEKPVSNIYSVANPWREELK